jgi:mannose-6-phosphate isomerase-like protein (cupin superfamily)
VFHVLSGDALSVRSTPTGTVGTVFSGGGIEVVWVTKQDEMIDPAWFSQHTFDLLVVLQGQLQVEFERRDLAALDLSPGDLLVLPPNTRCRAYRSPRDRHQATIFLAAYPKDADT